MKCHRLDENQLCHYGVTLYYGTRFTSVGNTNRTAVVLPQESLNIFFQTAKYHEVPDLGRMQSLTRLFKQLLLLLLEHYAYFC